MTPCCPCAPSCRHADEHYIPTLLAALGLENETYCDGWGVAAADWTGLAAHPNTYEYVVL